MYLNIAVVKNMQAEKHAALDPKEAQKLARNGAKIAVQSGAWSHEDLSGLVMKNIRFTSDVRDLVRDADLVLSVCVPAQQILEAMQESAVLVTRERPPESDFQIDRLLNRRITTIVADRREKESKSIAHFIASMVKGDILDPDWDNQNLSRLLFTHRGQIRRQSAGIR